jgi:hypothetical protein
MATMNSPVPSNPKEIAEAGERIYDEKYRAQYEAEHMGKFVAININSGHATLADTPEEALREAKAADPSGLLHLIRVGSAGAFRVSYTQHGDNDWLYR